ADLATPIPQASMLTAVDLLQGRAERLRLAGEPAAARELLEEVLAHEPTDVGVRQSLARVALALGDADLAGYWGATALDLQQGHGPSYRVRERRALPTDILGAEGALVDYSAVLREEEGEALALARRGLAHLRRGL